MIFGQNYIFVECKELTEDDAIKIIPINSEYVVSGKHYVVPSTKIGKKHKNKYRRTTIVHKAIKWFGANL
jgi:hypothetical protein